MLGIYMDKECTDKVDIIGFGSSIEYLDVDEMKKIFNVVPMGATSEADVYLKNEGATDCALYHIESTDPQVKVTIFTSGYIKVGGVMRINLSYTPIKEAGLEGTVRFFYHEIFK